MKRTGLLSPTQQKLMELLVGGKVTKQAAAILGMDMHTANTHVHRAKVKLGAKTRDQAMAMFAVSNTQDPLEGESSKNAVD